MPRTLSQRPRTSWPLSSTTTVTPAVSSSTLVTTTVRHRQALPAQHRVQRLQQPSQVLVPPPVQAQQPSQPRVPLQARPSHHHQVPLLVLTQLHLVQIQLRVRLQVPLLHHHQVPLLALTLLLLVQPQLLNRQGVPLQARLSHRPQVLLPVLTLPHLVQALL